MKLSKKGFFFIYTVLFIYFTFSLLTFSPYFFSETGGVSSELSFLVRISYFLPGILFLLFGWGAYFFIVFGLFVYPVFFVGSGFLFSKPKFFLGIILLLFTLLYTTILFTGDSSFGGGGILFGMLDDFAKLLFGLVGELFVLFFLFLSSFLLIFGISLGEFLSFVSTFLSSIFLSISSKSLESKPPLISHPVVDNDAPSNTVNTASSEVLHSVEDGDIIVSGLSSEAVSEEVAATESSLNLEGSSSFSDEGSIILEESLEEELDNSFFDDVSYSRLNLYRDFSITVLNSLSGLLSFDSGIISRDILPIDDNSSELIILSDKELDVVDNDISFDATQEVKKDVESIELVDSSSSSSSSVAVTTSSDKPSLYSGGKSSFFLAEGSDDISPSQEGLELLEEEKSLVSGKLENTLEEFGISAKVVNVSCGPVIMRYEILPAPGIRLSKISGLQDNIALALASSRIRVLAPIPGKSLVGIEIPNKNRKLVTLGELINSAEFNDASHILPIAIGKGIDGQILVADLASMPHLLIAGATGSGKSVFVNTLICSLLHSARASSVRLLLIDPKRVELSIYGGIPNLLAPVITDPQKALFALKWVVGEMERRYILLEKYGVRDIKGFNKKVKELKSNSYATDDYFEYMVIIIDEFADLMMTASKEVEGQVSRLAAMSRAVGIHLVIATQRPSVDVITGLIKANFPARMAFQVSSKMESRIILDGNGADKLLGRGDLLFLSPGSWGNVRVQGAFLKEDEILGFVNHLQGVTNYVPELENIEIEGAGEAGDRFSLDDELYTEAVELVRADGRASASYLQRKMRIGYNRAARMIELMEEEGIVSGQNGSKAREVLI